MTKKTKKEQKEPDLIDQILSQIDFHGLTQEQALGKDGILKQLTGKFLQAALSAEMDSHLGYCKHDNAGDNTGNYASRCVVLRTLPLQRRVRGCPIWR